MMRYLARVPIDIDGLVALLRSGTYTITSAIPESARPLQAHYDATQHRFWIILSVDTPGIVAEVPEGQLIPELDAPVIRRHAPHITPEEEPHA